MKVGAVYSHLNGEEYLKVHKPELLGEVRHVIESLDAESCKTKVSEVHHAPKHGSRLNIAEIEINALSAQCLRRRIPDRETLVREVAAWEKSRNAVGKSVSQWFRTGDARVKLNSLYPSIQ